MQVSVDEAKTRLSQLLELVRDGEEVLILRRGKPVARLSAFTDAKKSPFGAMKGEFQLPEGWDRPLTDKEAESFWQGKW